MGGVIKGIFGGGNSAVRAAERQAQAAMAAAEKQAAAIKASSDAQMRQFMEQSRGTAMAQQHATNQANLAAKLREQEQTSNQVPETKVETTPVAADPDPRRKYRRSDTATGGTGGGVGIRLT